MRESTAAKRDAPPLNGDPNVAFRVKCTKLGHGHRVSISCRHPPFIPSEYDGRSYEDNKALSRTAALSSFQDSGGLWMFAGPKCRHLPHEISNPASSSSATFTTTFTLRRSESHRLGLLGTRFVDSMNMNHAGPPVRNVHHRVELSHWRTVTGVRYSLLVCPRYFLAGQSDGGDVMRCRDCTRRSDTQQRLGVICPSHADTSTLLELMASPRDHQRPQSFSRIFILMFMVRSLSRKLEANMQHQPKQSFRILRKDALLPVFQITEAEADGQPSHAVPLS